MAQFVEPSPGNAESLPLSAALRYAFGDGWIVPSDTDLYASETGASGAPLDAFTLSATEALDATIETGEAFVSGKYLWKDTSTTVTLPDNSTTIIYLAWPAESGDDVRIDHENGTNYPTGEHGRLPLWEITTSDGVITESFDERDVGEQYTVDGEFDVGGDLTTSGREVVSEESAWDGNTLVLRTESGTTVEFDIE